MRSTGRPYSLPFDTAALPIIEAVLQVTLRPASYRIHGEPVYEAFLPNPVLGQDIRLVFWPSIARTDAYLADCQIIFKEITEMHVLPGVEVIFRHPPARGQLLVTRAGRVAIAA